MEVPLKLISVKGSNSFVGDSESCLGYYLSTCQALEFDYQLIGVDNVADVYFSKIASNPNLQSLVLTKLSSNRMIEAYLKLLPAVFTNSPSLKNLSLQKNNLFLWPREELSKLFEWSPGTAFR